MTLDEFIKKTNVVEFESGDIKMTQTRPRIELNDGFNVSVQAGWGIYSDPRNYADKYSEFELGYPSEKDEIIIPYCEDSENPTETVYGYVPKEIVEKLIKKHGGFTKEFIKKIDEYELGNKDN